MNNIRFRFSGFVIFFSRIISLITALAFTIIVTRNLSVQDFGLWQLISATISIALVPASIINFWLTRYEARNLGAARTGAILNIGMLGLGSTAYLLLAVLISGSVSSSFFIFLLAGVQVPLYYVVTNFESVALGSEPHSQGYAFIIFEILKVLAACILVYHLRYSLAGAIFAVAIAQVAQTIALGLMLRRRYDSSFNFSYAKKWLKVFWLPLFGGGTGATFVFVIDSLVVSTITSSSEPVGIYKLSFTLAFIVSYSSTLATALYPKLLGGGSNRDVENAFGYVLMLAIPMASGLLVLAQPLLTIMKPEYAIATAVLRTLVFAALATSVSNVMDLVIMGVEGVDLLEKPTFRDFTKSGLFLIPLLNNTLAIIYLGVLAILTNMFVHTLNPSWIPWIWATIFTASNLPFLAYKWHVAKRLTSFKLPMRRVGKYILASLVMVLPLAFLEDPLNAQVHFMPLASLTIATIFLGVCIYSVVLYLIDKDFRELFHVVIRELGKRL